MRILSIVALMAFFQTTAVAQVNNVNQAATLLCQNQTAKTLPYLAGTCDQAVADAIASDKVIVSSYSYELYGPLDNGGYFDLAITTEGAVSVTGGGPPDIAADGQTAFGAEVGRCFKAANTCLGSSFKLMTSQQCGAYCGTVGGKWLDPKTSACLQMGE